MTRGISSVLKAAKERIQEVYHRQPVIIVTQPFRVKQHSIEQFEMKGLILDKCKEPRKISQSGNSPHINIPCNWADLLTPPLHLRLYQTDKKGIIIEEVGGEAE